MSLNKTGIQWAENTWSRNGIGHILGPRCESIQFARQGTRTDARNRKLEFKRKLTLNNEQEVSHGAK